MNPPIKINRREKVPCFGNEPKTDLELLRRINGQIQRDRYNLIIIAAIASIPAALLFAYAVNAIWHMIH